MIYKIIVDKQNRNNPSSDKKEYEIDIEELRCKDEVHDSLIITKDEDYVIRRLELTKYYVLKELAEPIKEPLSNINIELFEGENYIYLFDMTGNKLYAEYLVKNEFNDIYVTQAKFDSKISQTAKEIEISVNKKLAGYSTTEEMNAAIQLTANEINSEVSKKVNESELGTKITQNSDAVKAAWNQISQYIQLDILDNMANISILNENGRLMALNKNGQNFYKNGNKFGSMGIIKAKDSDANNYGLAFVLDGEISGNNIKPSNNFMGFCYKSKDSSGNEIIIPFFYLGKIKSSQKSGVHMISDLYFEGNSIIADEFYIKNSSGQNNFIISNNCIIYKNNLIQNLINTYSDNTQGINAITEMYVVSDSPMGLFAIDANGNSGYWIGDDSDKKLKSNIKDSNISALEIIEKIKHRKFTWKKSGKQQSIGYIAQEIEKLNKDLVYKFPKDFKNQTNNDDDYSYQINNVAMNALSTKAIQELYTIVKKQQNQIEILNKEIARRKK